MARSSPQLWIETPLIYSSHLSARVDANVYLKLENLQPSQSFKSRGISLFSQRAKELHGSSVHLIAASGGNAGVAAACAANALNVRCTIYLPEGVPEPVIAHLKRENAQVIVHGVIYTDALFAAEAAVANDPYAVMVPAYDHPTLWEGHGTLVREMSKQLNERPSAIICSVGGGGLLGGIINGCQAVGWEDVPIVAIETHEANCFYQSIAANKSWPSDTISNQASSASVTLDEKYQVLIAHSKPTSKATSLGATCPSAGIVKRALDRPGAVHTVTVADAVAMRSVCGFADEHKMLVEMACGTALASVYERPLAARILALSLYDSEKRSRLPERLTLVVVVCGGTKVSADDLVYYKDSSNADSTSGSSDRNQTAMFNGERLAL